MAWNMTGQMLEACSCKMFCPCNFGPAEPDQGWCSAALGFDIRQGNADGVNLGGTKAAVVLDLPGDFVSGNATARLYIDEAASVDQRRELEAIFTGKKGGLWEALGAMITKWLPAQVKDIQIRDGGSPSCSVGDIGQVTLQPIKNSAGQPTQMVNAPTFEAFAAVEDVARSDGSRWSDPDLRQWEAGGAGGVSAFDWSA